MGAQVQYNIMRDLIEEAGGYWSQYYDARTHTGHVYNDIMLRSPDDYSEGEREKLKRTMLEHEYTFRKQVYELHRLYSRQRNLMDEIKRQEPPRFFLPVDSRAQGYFSHVLFDDSKKMQQLPFPTVGTSNLNISPNAAFGDMKSHLTFMGDNHLALSNGTLRNNEYMNYNLRSSPRLRFDLELPANACSGIESKEKVDKECLERPLFRNSSHDVSSTWPNNDLKLTLSKGEEFCSTEGNKKLFTDLNEPVNGIEGSAPNQNGYPSTPKEDVDAYFRERQHSVLGLHSPLPKNGIDHGGNSLNFLQGNVRRELALFTGGSGKGADVHSVHQQFCYEKIARPAEASRLEISNHEFLSPGHSKRDILFMKGSDQKNGRNGLSGFSQSAQSRNLGKEISQIPGSLPPMSSPSMPTNSMSHFFNSRQTLPCFNLHNKHEQKGEFFTSSSRIVGAVASQANGFLNGFPSVSSKRDLSATSSKHDVNVTASISDYRHSDYHEPNKLYKGSLCADVKSAKGFDLNQILPETENLNEEISSVHKRKTFVIDLDLNSAVQCEEEYPDASEASQKEKENALSSSARLKLFSGIDLEVPVSEDANDDLVLQEQSTVGDSHMGHIGEQPCVTNCLSGFPDEQSVREAAEHIVAMSSDMHSCFVDSQPSLVPGDSLHWLADLATNLESLVEVRELGNGESETVYDDEWDLFEYMTLKLKETAADECLPNNPSVLDNSQGNDSCGAMLLLTKPRRGPARKRRQRRDFQKDILPGLVTLSRNEVSEDLQTIEGLVRASGGFWQGSVPRRNVGRRPKARAKTMQQQRCLAASVEETIVSPPSEQPVITECKIDANIVGWGRTRRCRRQRFPTSIVHIPNLKA